MEPTDETVVEALRKFLLENPDATVDDLEDAFDAADVLSRLGKERLDFDTVLRRLERRERLA